MYYPNLKDFIKLSKTSNVIPVYKEINADLDTPVSAFLKIKKDDYAFLLESVEGQEHIARYSFLGSRPSLVFKSKDKAIELIYPHKNKRLNFITQTSPFDEIKKIMQDFRCANVLGLPRFFGGLVGYIGYDTVRFVENIPDKNPDDINIPDIVLLLTDTILIFDHVNHRIKIVNNVIFNMKDKNISLLQKQKIYGRAINKIASIEHEFLNSVRPKETRAVSISGIKVSSNFTKKGFAGIVRKAKEYIKRGDIIQVVLSQRFQTKIKRQPFEIYRSLRSLNPSPYMFFLELKDISLIGSSPEMLVRCEAGDIETRPIAGTRPRGGSETEDKKLEIELLNDAKEKAEHLMLVDLGRNDLGRVSEIGSVEVSEFMRIEKYSHVMHLVSEVKGKLDRRRYDVYDTLKAAFPAGTVTGSPKIRAMEIIDELENLRRGIYAGCVGYFSFSHNIDTCITIRTILVKDKTAYIQAGAGIVADSVPEREYLESVNKAKALIEALVI